MSDPTDWNFPRLQLRMPGIGDSEPSIRGGFRYRLVPDLELRLDAGIPGVPLLDLRDLFLRPRFQIPQAAQIPFDTAIEEAEELPWDVPDVQPPRTADALTTTLQAVLRTPWGQQARARLEEWGRRELRRIWQTLRARPGNFALAPIPLSVAAGGLVTIASQHNFELPKLPVIPLGRGVGLELRYVHRIQDAVRDPLHPREAGVLLHLDLAKLVPGLR